MSRSRTENSIRNLKSAVFYKLLAILVNFIARRIFIDILSAEYLGLNGTFANILSVLSLAELGIGSAMVFSMYKPLAENDENTLASLMVLYRRMYAVIGVVVAAAGALIMPFLPALIKDIPDIPNINIIYLMFVFNSVFSYFFVYKQSIINADQKQHIITKYSYITSMLCTVVQCIVLILTRDYLLYLSISIITTIANNILLSRKAEKLYPYIKCRTAAPLPAEKKEELSKNIRAMIMHKLGSVVVFGTDNILIAYFVGAVSVGLYSNYYMITSALNSAYSMLFRSMTASVGNLNAEADKHHLREMYFRIDGFTQWLFGFSSICLLILLNPFITLWVGKEYLFGMTTVLIIVVNFYMTGIRQANLVFREAMGLYWYDRYKPLAESLINLAASIMLARQLGILGVFIGTFISTVTTCFWIEPFVLFKYGFGRPVWVYFKRFAVNTVITLLAGAAAWKVCGLIPDGSVLTFAAKMSVCALLPNAVYFIFYHKTDEFKYFFALAGRLVRPAGRKP